MVGLVLAGMAVGPHAERSLNTHQIALSALGEFGLLYLMFAAGLELDIKLFSRMKKAAITFALLSFVIPFSLGIVSAKLVGYAWAAAVLMGAYRFVFGMAALLSGAVLAEAATIDGIVGAFFAGLGLNRAIPERSPLMDRIQFFGSAWFIAIFHVSVGVLLDPKVLIDPRTLVVALVFSIAVLGGKALAAAGLTRRSRARAMSSSWGPERPFHLALRGEVSVRSRRGRRSARVGQRERARERSSRFPGTGRCARSAGALPGGCQVEVPRRDRGPPRRPRSRGTRRRTGGGPEHDVRDLGFSRKTLDAAGQRRGTCCGDPNGGKSP